MPESTLHLAEVEPGLLGSGFAGRVHSFAVTGSTNQLALEAANAGVRTGVWVADEQTAGRGRGGHTWHSAPGDGLYMSALVRPHIPVREARWLPMRAGLAVRAAVEDLSGILLDLRWPNDLYLHERKCGGILVESASEAAPRGWQAETGPALQYAVIGIGLNLGHTSFPPEIAHRATSLLIETGQIIAREAVLPAILQQLEREMREQQRSWEGSENGHGVITRFTGASTWVTGKRVRVGGNEQGQGGYTAVTRGLDPDGFLRVEDDEGLIRTVVSGNVRDAGE